MSTQSLILILLMALTSKAFARSDDIFASIAQVKAKMESLQSLEARKKEFVKFHNFICGQREALGPEVRAARENMNLTEDQVLAVEAKRYNYYDFCDDLKGVPLTQKQGLSNKGCESFSHEIRRALDQDGTAMENTLTDLNYQAIQIGRMLYRCQ